MHTAHALNNTPANPDTGRSESNRRNRLIPRSLYNHARSTLHLRNRGQKHLHSSKQYNHCQANTCHISTRRQGSSLGIFSRYFRIKNLNLKRLPTLKAITIIRHSPLHSLNRLSRSHLRMPPISFNRHIVLNKSRSHTIPRKLTSLIVNRSPLGILHTSSMTPRTSSYLIIVTRRGMNPIPLHLDPDRNVNRFKSKTHRRITDPTHSLDNHSTTKRPLRRRRLSILPTARIHSLDLNGESFYPHSLVTLYSNNYTAT